MEDLRALRELNDELEEQHVETEKQMLEQIEELQRGLAFSRDALEAKEASLADYEKTIVQFRELVRVLQS